MKRYENEEYSVDEIQGIDELVFFEAEDYKPLELLNNAKEEFKSKEIQDRIVDANNIPKTENKDSLNKKLNQLKTTMSGTSSTIATSMVVVTAVIGVGAVLPSSVTDNYGSVEFINYVLDYNETSELLLFFDEGLEEGFYCNIVNKETGDKVELVDGVASFSDLDPDMYEFEINILNKDNDVISTDFIDIDLSLNPYLGVGEFDYTITYNEDNTSNLYILLDAKENFNSFNFYLKSEDNKLTYTPTIIDNFIIFEDIAESEFLIEGKSYYTENNNSHTIYNYSSEFDINYEIEFDISAENDTLSLSSPYLVEGNLNVMIQYLDTNEEEEFVITSDEINGLTKTINLSRVAEEYILYIDGNFYVSNPVENIEVTKGNYYKKVGFSKLITPNINTMVSLDRVEILNDYYGENYTEQDYGIPTKLYFDGYLNESDSLTVNVYNSDKSQLLTSLENIKTIDKPVEFYSLDTTMELVFEYIIYQEGTELSKEEYKTMVSIPDEYTSPYHNLNNPNPLDIYVTYNYDGTYNAYFNMNFVNHSSYDLEYKVELMMFDEEGTHIMYEYLGVDSIAAIYNIKANYSYGIRYSLFVKDGINYYAAMAPTIPSGTIEVQIEDNVILSSTSLHETEVSGVYETYILGIAEGDIDVEIMLDKDEQTHKISIPNDQLILEYDNSGEIYAFTIQLDLSMYSFETAIIKISAMTNPFYGLGNIIKSSGFEIIGNDSINVIYEAEIIKGV